MTTKEQINNNVWKACDIFRGTLDSSEYKDYILTILFIKYLSDLHKEKYEELYKKYKGNEERIQRALKKEKFKITPDSTFEYLLQRKEQPNLGEIINKVLSKIEENNKDKLDLIFRNIDFNSEAKLGNTKERNVILKSILENFEKLDLRPSKLSGRDVIGDVYEYLISRFASDAGKKGGEFFTPSEVSELLAKLTSKDEESLKIYDPTCGSGSLLIKASKEIKDKNFRIYGQEKNGQTYALCRMNMFLHEIENADIKWGDTLRNPLHLEDNHLAKFDIIVANPPFSLDKWGADELQNDRFKRFEYGMPPKSKGDYAFVLHMIKSLNENGNMGVVLPHGVLFRGSSEAKIRKKLIENNLLDAVIGLPSNLFFGTSIPACILIFKKNRKNKDILFIDASREFEKGKNQNKLTPENITKIYETYKDRKEIDKYSHLASIEEIEENDYNLNIPRYVDTFEEEEPIDINKTKENIAKIENELNQLKTKMKNYLEELGL